MIARIIACIACVTLSLYGFERVPKQYSLEFGGIYAHKNEISHESLPGATVLFDYSWQLSGLDGTRPASFITVPMGYTVFSGDSSLSILQYGWTIRHDLTKSTPVIPFLGYGLLLNQLHYEGDKGSRFGHQTRFDVGAEWFNDRPFHLFAKGEWSMTRFPERTGGSDWFYSAGVKVGVRFCKAPREKKNTIAE